MMVTKTERKGCNLYVSVQSIPNVSIEEAKAHPRLNGP